MKFLNLNNKYKILLGLFFTLLLTSLWSNNIYVLVLFSLLAYFVLPNNQLWDTTSLLLLSFSFIYSIILLITGQVLSYFIVFAYLLAPVAFYRLGRWLVHVYRTDDQRNEILFIIILLYLTPLFILTIKDILAVGLVNIDRAMTGHINTEGALSATYYGLLSSVGLGCLSAFFAKGQKLSIRIGYILVALFSLLVVVHLVNRSGLIIGVLILITATLWVSRRNFSKSIKVVLLLLLIGLLMYQSEIFNETIFNAYQSRETGSSYDSVEFGGRLTLWVNAVSKVFTSPFGWTQNSYAHNYLLDTARVGGWIPFILLLVATCGWIKYFLKLIKKEYSPFVLYLICISISIFLSMMVEPVLDCSILYFSLFTMFWGMTRDLSTEKNVN